MPLYEFKNGIGAGVIAMFVGLVELMLEFVKPVTLSFRLFGNIYGGEVALAVITALTIVIFPIGLYGLDFLLNAIQALIFSILTLVFITLAIESHDHEEGHVAEEALDALEHRDDATAAASPLARQRARPTTRSQQVPGRRPGSRRKPHMEHIGAGLAALGVFGPGIGIGILGGLAATAIGRNPDAAGQIRGIAIILAAFAEGLGVLAVVVGLLAIFIK